MINQRSLVYSDVGCSWSKKKRAMYCIFLWLLDPNDEWSRQQRRQFGYALPKRYLVDVKKVTYIDLENLISCKKWKDFILDQNQYITNKITKAHFDKIKCHVDTHHTNTGKYLIKHITKARKWEILK